jgi:hypothetical protein
VSAACARRSPCLVPLALALLLAGCVRELPLALPHDVAAQVTEPGGAVYLLEPASEDYRRLDAWLARNRSGWSWAHYYATPPARGFVVRAGSLHLQFFDSTVLARTPQGDFLKSVAPADYAFLKRGEDLRRRADAPAR